MSLVTPHTNYAHNVVSDAKYVAMSTNYGALVKIYVWGLVSYNLSILIFFFYLFELQNYLTKFYI